MPTSLKLFMFLALAFSAGLAKAQTDYSSNQEYEKPKTCVRPSFFYPDGDSGQLTLLVMCIDRGEVGILDKLLTAAPDFANVNEGMSSCSPIHWAAFKGNTNILGVLLKHGADIKKKGTNWKISALHIARDAQTAEFLLNNGADIEDAEVHGQTPLMWAAKRGNLNVAEALIKHGARLDTHDQNGWTALELARVFGHTNVVTLLASKGADPSRKSTDDFPYELTGGSFLQYGTNHPFAQLTLVSDYPLTNAHPVEIK